MRVLFKDMVLFLSEFCVVRVHANEDLIIIQVDYGKIFSD